MITEKLLFASISSSAGGVWLGLTDAVSIAIVTQIGALALAGLAAFISWRTHKAVNGKMEEFKAMFAQAKINEGVLQEKKEETVRKAEIVLSIKQGDNPTQHASTPEIQSPSQGSATISNMVGAIKAVPEKTATKVVEKIEQREKQP